MKHGDIIEIQDPMIMNNLGGANIINGFFKVKYISESQNNDMDKKYIGELIKEEDINNARKIGMTKYTPDDYKDFTQYNQCLYKRVLKAYNNYNPQFVYFNDIDIF